MKTVRQLLDSKADQAVYSIPSQASVREALVLMGQKNIGALMVVDGGKMVGIISERDYARKVVLQNRSSSDTKVSDIMTTAVLSVSAEERTQACMSIMTEKRLRHLPVMDNGELVGIVSIGDLVKDVIAQQQQLIDQLEQYIRGE